MAERLAVPTAIALSSPLLIWPSTAGAFSNCTWMRPGDEVDQRRPGAAIGDVGEVDAGERLEQLGREKAERADASRAVADRAGLGARQLDQVARPT